MNTCKRSAPGVSAWIVAAAQFVLPQFAGAQSTAVTATHAAMAAEWNYMLAGSGEWRTPNPDFSDPATTPKEYAVRFRWAKHEQHVTGELLGIYPTADGEKTVVYWHFYSWYNPADDEITLLQIGWNGAMGSGTFIPQADGPSILEQTFHNPDGTTIDVRHENVHTSEREHASVVYHRDETGAWQRQQDWVWTRVD